MMRRANTAALRDGKRSSTLGQRSRVGIEVEEVKVAVGLHLVDDAAIVIEYESRRLRTDRHRTARIDQTAFRKIHPHHVNGIAHGVCQE